MVPDEQFIGNGMCLQLLAKWRHSAHLKLSQLILIYDNNKIFLVKKLRRRLYFFSFKLLDGITSVPVSIQILRPEQDAL